PSSAAQAPAGDLCPQRERELLDGWLWPKWSRRRDWHVRSRSETTAESRKDCFFAARRLDDRSATLGGRGIFREGCVDIRPRPHPPFEIPLGLELIESGYGRATRQTVMLGQIARRRQLGAAPQPSVEDCRS